MRSNNFYPAGKTVVLKILLVLGTTLFLTVCSNQQKPYSVHVEKAKLELDKKGRTLQVKAYIPRGITEFELHIESDRNKPITRTSTISPYDVDSIQRKERYSNTDKEIWYPVVDVKPDQGMDAVCVFKGNPSGWYVFGSPFYREENPISKMIVLPAHQLEYWGNSLTVNSRAHEIEQFYLRRTYPVLLREFRHTFELLSEDWSGRISLHTKDGDGLRELASEIVPEADQEWWAEEVEEMKGSGLSRERLTSALELLIDNGLNRQNNNPASPMYGSLFAFYDLEARLHRTSYWTWAGSHYVKMVLDAMKVQEIRDEYKKAELHEAVEKIGRVYLKYQVRENNHPSKGSFLVIWSRRHTGYTKWVGTSDSGIIIRWALVPLFQATGDSSYLESALYWHEKKEKMVDTVEILPHFHMYDEDEFSTRILDETGWDPEGHAALFELTGKNRFRESGRKYMDKHMKVFQREDGLWQRSHDWKTGDTQETARMVRGCGWAMEGLLAMNRMYPDSIYLDYARRMGDLLAAHQHPSGCWSFVFDRPPEEVGISEKGTAIWSLLFYQLYRATGEIKYLETARKALLWCLDNQYTGPDPEAIGGLVGRTNASMVGIRYFYDATCSYTTGFFGLAILEEMKLMGMIN